MRRILCLSLAGFLMACTPPLPRLVVFQAPQVAPAIRKLAPDMEHTLGASLSTEVAGSQTLCRMVTDLGRECDLLLLADAELYKSLAASQVRWRVEFAHDEMVLGLGIRARRVDEAERDWASVVALPDIVLARVNEDLGPVGYRTLLLWRLWELQGHPGFFDRLKSRDMRLAEHAEQLAAWLKSGDAEYAFLYRTTCQAHEIRYLRLPPEVNLGSPGQAYDRAEVNFTAWSGGRKTIRTVRGRLITCGAAIPVQAPHPALAATALRYIFKEHLEAFSEMGFTVIAPRFYGPQEDHQIAAPWTEWGGEF
ncbi:MAG: substrate-binding domain-containing protein [candidate division FCPU426 bacterium]